MGFRIWTRLQRTLIGLALPFRLEGWSDDGGMRRIVWRRVFGPLPLLNLLLMAVAAGFLAESLLVFTPARNPFFLRVGSTFVGAPVGDPFTNWWWIYLYSFLSPLNTVATYLSAEVMVAILVVWKLRAFRDSNLVAEQLRVMPGAPGRIDRHLVAMMLCSAVLAYLGSQLALGTFAWLISDNPFAPVRGRRIWESPFVTLPEISPLRRGVIATRLMLDRVSEPMVSAGRALIYAAVLLRWDGVWTRMWMILAIGAATFALPLSAEYWNDLAGLNSSRATREAINVGTVRMLVQACFTLASFAYLAWAIQLLRSSFRFRRRRAMAGTP